MIYFSIGSPSKIKCNIESNWPANISVGLNSWEMVLEILAQAHAATITINAYVCVIILRE